MKAYFPYDEVREVQQEFMDSVYSALERKKSVIAHAPTGIGKTAAALAPALFYALKEKKTIFFLTSRHTQHKIAIETLKLIQERFALDFSVVDIVGKKNMCLQESVGGFYTSEFFEYCKRLRENDGCDYYKNLYKNNQMTVDGKHALSLMMDKGILSSVELVDELKEDKKPCCPYEIAQQLAKKATVVIADYFYMFNPSIRNMFLGKMSKELSDVIIIVDEAHNMPGRIRELLTVSLSMKQVDRAIKEAEKHEFTDLHEKLGTFKELFYDLNDNFDPNEQRKFMNEQEMIIAKEPVIEKVKAIDDYDKFIDDLETAGETVLVEKDNSSLISIARFLQRWEDDGEGFIRYIQKDHLKDDNITIRYRCLDPSVLSKEVVNSAHSVIMMSGTLMPTAMYRDLMGFEPEDVMELEFDSPFPKENKLSLIIPKATTRYAQRSEAEFKRMGEICAECSNLIKGNVIIFFPSYSLLSSVERFFNPLCKKTTMKEVSGISTAEKQSMIERFKGYKKTGAVMLAVASGSFGEGIDLPGDLLNGVIVVGIPLQIPDLETRELMKYYDLKFGKGRDYGYTYPAFNKVLQNAGRCIRSESDKGVLIFLDERYLQREYFRCFPKDYHVQISRDHKAEIVEFFW